MCPSSSGKKVDGGQSPCLYHHARKRDTQRERERERERDYESEGKVEPTLPSTLLSPLDSSDRDVGEGERVRTYAVAATQAPTAPFSELHQY